MEAGGSMFSEAGATGGIEPCDPGARIVCSGPLQKQHTLVTMKAKQGLLPFATLQSRHFSA